MRHTATSVHAGRLSALSPRAKLIALIVFAVVVVATPREWVWAFAGYGGIILVLLVAARVPPRTLLGRLTIEIPFVVFAILMPFVASGPRIEVVGLSLAVAGLWGAWGLLVKATLTLLAAVVLVSTTEPRRIVMALESMRMPRQLTSIMGFMIRYLDVIGDEAARMRTAREARGFTARGPRSWGVLGKGVGALFVRAHARGERVHLAMLARGYAEAGERA